MYNNVLEALEKSERSAVVTLITGDESFNMPVGSKRFYSPSKTVGSFNHDSLNLTADRLAEQSLKSGRLLTCRETLPGTDKEFMLAAEPFFPPEQLVIFGGGNISYALLQITNLLGYNTIVIDDRPSFANKKRFPASVKVICDDFVRAIDKISFGPWSSVIIVTRGHQHDLACLQRVVDKELAYLGMIGSRRRIRMVKHYLKEQGIDENKIERVHMPIGLDIGAETPEEIAVSIAGELIKVRRGGNNQSLSGVNMKANGYQGISTQEIDILKTVEKYKQHQNIAAALATVVTTKGSTPRKAGAKLIVLRNGQIIGTIGGGCVENEVRREAIDVMDSGKPGLYKFFLDNDVAANEGMACGGTLEVFIEPAK